MYDIMDGVCTLTLLCKLQTFSEYDIRVIRISPSYVKTDQRVSLDPASTIKNLLVSKFPWMHIDHDDCTVGFGLCTNNEPECMTWNRARVAMNKSIRDLWPHTTLAPTQEYLIVCCLFSREQYNMQKDRLETVIDEMGKWLPLKK
jgi:hypothetical protein